MKINLIAYVGLCTFVSSAFTSDLFIYNHVSPDEQQYVAWIASIKYFLIPAICLPIYLIARKRPGVRPTQETARQDSSDKQV